MITFFRRFFQSKIGIAVTLAFLGLIAFAFASADVSSTGTFGGVSGGDRVAVVGDEKISTSDLSRAASNAVDSMRQQNPTISMEEFIGQGGLQRVLDQVLEQTAISEFAETYGLRAGTNLVNSEIMSIPVFRGADGNFDEDAYRQALAQRGLTDASVRDELRNGLLAKQILLPASFGATAPDKLAVQYASLLRETRKGAIAVLPSTAFAPDNDPTAPQLQGYYEENQADFIRPERRIIRYLSFDDSAVGDLATPTAAEVAARYEENKEAFAASEQRTITQMIVATQAAANAIRDRVNSGGSLAVAAREAGLQTAQLGPISKDDYAAQTSSAVADAVFAAAEGKVAQPARSGLGFHVVLVNDITRTAGKTLEQARAEIRTALTEEKRQAAIADLSADIEEKVDNGIALSDIAQELGVEVSTTRPVTGDGAIYGSSGKRVPQILGPALQTAFQMEESKPQLAAIVPGQLFLVFEVSEITRSAAAPLADIRERVIASWKLSEGLARARVAADRIMERIEGGATISAAMAAEEVTLPSFDTINMNREQLAQTGQQVPAPLALLFSMAEGTTKKLEAPSNAGWFVVRLDNIEEGTVAEDDPIFAQTKQQISSALEQEYGEQLRTAIKAEIGSETNETAVEAVRKQLTGER
ncbi:SurA N-terminal domain-containing protein [Pontixanthobacter aestiaquae]|uniref:Parvulin-like PPIase n=1 Tax=Pontixanthobacter aestiaquae TaxID=1509367 RepID=A0A844ZCW5_9SPHN|nr:peptidylprolyl isomerase [Pontixanthobacter aestiaquae]MDN3645350.1 SurA N-terminal domain-containing protein [Pontixanthobacter aestiaquae]MXO83649.1 peptidylprolyl isomerase [Pontixanthobacter aestiaquae]